MSLVESGQKPQRNEKGQIVAGMRLNPNGRAKGNRNKLAEVYIDALYHKWQEHGDSVIDRVIKEQPAQFLKVIAQLMPKDVNVTVRQLDDLTDDQLIQRLRQVTEMARPLLAIDVTPDATPAPLAPQRNPEPVVHDALSNDINELAKP